MEKLIFLTILIICLLFPGCRDSTKIYPVDFVKRSEVFPAQNSAQTPDPLRLVIEISEDGKLSLNKIETGTIDDLSELSERLKAVFDEREKASINEREIVIDPKEKIESEELERLVETLANLKASPIRVIKLETISSEKFN